jgi:DNA invertase Pin-like site-specific DNA recombinase
MANTRILVAARLSRITDSGRTRIERDDEAAQRSAASREDATIVAVSEDAGVSGGTSPWKRPSLGKWLTDPNLIASYDEILASSIDRLGRSARDLHDLRAWAEDHGKTIRILSPALVWPPSPDDFSGPIVWDVLARVAEIERQMISKRYKDMRVDLRANEALVGRPPWGYIVVGEKGGKSLALDPDLVPYLQGMIDRARRGDSYLSICRWLDGEGLPPPHGIKWSPHSVVNALRNPALKGRRIELGKVVLRFESLLSSTEWQALQDLLDSRPTRRGPVSGTTALLTGVIECDRCGGPMYRFRSGRNRKDGTRRINWYYRCRGTDTDPSSCGNSVPLADIEEWVNLWFTTDVNGAFSNTEIIETTLVPGDDHAAEIAEIEAEMRELDPDADDWIEQAQALRSERARLKALPSEPSQVVERPTGITVGEVWAGLDEQARRSYLLASRIKIRVLSSAERRATPGAETRYIRGNPHKLIGSLQEISTAN